LMVVLIARFVPAALHNFPALPAFLYFAAHGRDTRGPLLPFVTVYVGLIGCGLWRLWGWARRSLIFSSGVKASPHVRHPSRDPDLRAGRKRDHERRLFRTAHTRP
jgi:hypothetical protein